MTSQTVWMISTFHLSPTKLSSESSKLESLSLSFRRQFRIAWSIDGKRLSLLQREIRIVPRKSNSFIRHYLYFILRIVLRSKPPVLLFSFEASLRTFPSFRLHILCLIFLYIRLACDKCSVSSERAKFARTQKIKNEMKCFTNLRGRKYNICIYFVYFNFQYRLRGTSDNNHSISPYFLYL